MAIVDNPFKRLINITVTTTDTTTSGVFTLHPAATHFVVLASFTLAGNMNVYWVDDDGNNVLIDTTAVSAATPVAVPFAYAPRQIAVDYNPTAGSGTGFIEVAYGGHGGSFA